MTKQTQTRTRFRVAHITFETIVCPRSGTTFALYAGDMERDYLKRMFSGHVERGMGAQLRRLARHFDELEEGMDK